MRGYGHDLVPLSSLAVETQSQQDIREKLAEEAKNMELAAQKSFDNTISKCESCQNALIVRFLPNPKESKTDPLCVKCNIEKISNQTKTFWSNRDGGYECWNDYWYRKVLQCSSYQQVSSNVLKE